jgi:hypothetical protein
VYSSRISRYLMGAMAVTGLAFAQSDSTTTPAPAAPTGPTATTAAPAPADPPKSPFTHWGTDFSFLADGYVDGNFNHPDSGFNQLHNFDFRADNVHLSMAKITIDHGPAPVGFHLDVGFGQAFDVIHSADRAPDAFKYFEQAYISFKPKSWKGVEVDAGEFVTAAGAEVIETNANWNYTRSLLFALAIPYYHFGVRASVPITKNLTAGVQVVQGWNNIYDNNSGKSIGLNDTYTWKKVSWTNVWYGGPEKTGTNDGWRNLYDTTVLVNQNDKLSYYINFDYGRDKNVGAGSQKWTGVAGALHYQAAKKFAVAARAEVFDDMDGFSTGTPQTLKELTFTGEYKMTDWLLSRLEFRDDWSDAPYFQKGSGTAMSQPTILFGMVAFIGPKK